MRRWWLLLGLLLLALPAAAQPRLALVIGNQNYTQVRKLENSLADARAMATALRERGFEVSEHHDLDRVRMLAAFDAFKRRISPGSVVVFYFAGHGVALDGANYLLPVDIARESEELAQYNALPLQSVMDGLASQNSRREDGLNLLILDACRDNPFRDHSRGAAGGLSTRPGAGLMMLYAASSGQSALDKLGSEDRNPNGVFTRTLLKAMRSPGLGVRAMAERVQREVGALTGRRQVPAFYSEALGDYVFTPGEAQPVAADGLAAAEREELEQLRRERAPAVAPAAATPSTPAQQQVAAAQLPSPPPATSQRGYPVPVGQSFRDCPLVCPEMVVIPAGDFTMGSPTLDLHADADERPPRRVRVSAPLAVGKHEVTFQNWDACVAEGGCGGHRPNDQGWGRGRHPVITVSWVHAQSYVRWLSGRTGQRYRLLTEAEWEYAARAGTETAYAFGPQITPGQANYNNGQRARTQEVGIYPANPFGLHDMHGNVWEWVMDGYRDSYAGAPADAGGMVEMRDNRRVMRGGSWADRAEGLRSANREWLSPTETRVDVGFRVARDPR